MSSKIDLDEEYLCGAKMRFKVGDVVETRGHGTRKIAEIKEGVPCPYRIAVLVNRVYQFMWFAEHELSGHRGDVLPATTTPTLPAMGDVQAQAKVKAEKPRMDLLFGFGSALIAVAEVLTFGAKKYTDDSWKRDPFTAVDYLAALGRHLAEIGEHGYFARDKETKLLHAAHAACDALMFCWHVIKDERK